MILWTIQHHETSKICFISSHFRDFLAWNFLMTDIIDQYMKLVMPSGYFHQFYKGPIRSQNPIWKLFPLRESHIDVAFVLNKITGPRTIRKSTKVENKKRICIHPCKLILCYVKSFEVWWFPQILWRGSFIIDNNRDNSDSMK